MAGMCGLYRGMGYIPPVHNFGTHWRNAAPPQPHDDAPRYPDSSSSNSPGDSSTPMSSSNELIISSVQASIWNWTSAALSHWTCSFAIFFWPAAVVLRKAGFWSWAFAINVYLCWQGRLLLEYVALVPAGVAAFENSCNYGLAILPAVLHAWFFVLKQRPLTATQVVDSMFSSRSFPGLFVFVWPPVGVWMESGLWSLDFLISVCLWEPLLEYPISPRIMGLFVSCLVASVLYAWYVVRRPKPVPISALEITASRRNTNYWDILFSLLKIIFFPFLCVLQKKGFWSLDFPINVGLCGFAYLRWSSLQQISWYNVRFLSLGLLPCVFHAWYIVATTSRGLFVFDRFRGWELWEVKRKRVRIGGMEQELGEMVERWGIGSLKHG